MLHQCIDSLVQKLQSGVVIHFEKIGPEPPPLAQDDTKDTTDTISRADTIILDDKANPLQPPFHSKGRLP